LNRHTKEADGNLQRHDWQHPDHHAEENHARLAAHVRRPERVECQRDHRENEEDD
jgi:hypothetical protein